MSLIIPDPRFEMPELFEPGGKPNGPVVIDWDHPFVRRYKLVSGLIPIMGWKNIANQKDVVTVNRPSIVNGAFVFNGSNQYAFIDKNDHGLEGLSAFSVVGGATATSNDSMIVSIHELSGAGTGRGDYQVYAVTSQYLHRAYRSNYTDITPYTSNVLNKNIRFLSSQFGGTTEQFILTLRDGVLTKTSVTATVGSVLGRKFLIGTDADSVGTDGDGSLGNWFGGSIDFLWIFAQPISESDGADLIRNPYQFLIPA